jgi:hypothetical protein
MGDHFGLAIDLNIVRAIKPIAVNQQRHLWIAPDVFSLNVVSLAVMTTLPSCLITGDTKVICRNPSFFTRYQQTVVVMLQKFLRLRYLHSTSIRV